MNSLDLSENDLPALLQKHHEPRLTARNINNHSTLSPPSFSGAEYRQSFKIFSKTDAADFERRQRLAISSLPSPTSPPDFKLESRAESRIRRSLGSQADAVLIHQMAGPYSCHVSQRALDHSSSPSTTTGGSPEDIAEKDDESNHQDPHHISVSSQRSTMYVTGRASPKHGPRQGGSMLAGNSSDNLHSVTERSHYGPLGVSVGPASPSYGHANFPNGPSNPRRFDDRQPYHSLNRESASRDPRSPTTAYHPHSRGAHGETDYSRSADSNPPSYQSNQSLPPAAQLLALADQATRERDSATSSQPYNSMPPFNLDSKSSYNSVHSQQQQSSHQHSHQQQHHHSHHQHSHPHQHQQIHSPPRSVLSNASPGLSSPGTTGSFPMEPSRSSAYGQISHSSVGESIATSSTSAISTSASATLDNAPSPNDNNSSDYATGPDGANSMHISSPNGMLAVTPGGFRCTHPGCTAAPFQTQYLLNSHANVHSDERPHFCPHEGCPHAKGGRGFKRKNEMKRHQLVHNSPGYTCPFCPERNHKYPRPDNLQRHVRAHHEGVRADDPKLREVLESRRGYHARGDSGGASRGRKKRAS